MKQLLIRADDIGYSYAVDLGITRAVNEGLVRSAGLMPNMPEAARGWEWVKDADIAIGQHIGPCHGVKHHRTLGQSGVVNVFHTGQQSHIANVGIHSQGTCTDADNSLVAAGYDGYLTADHIGDGNFPGGGSGFRSRRSVIFSLFRNFKFRI